MPPNALKLKVGDGGIPANLLKMGQSFLENNHVDFTPYANNFLEQLKKIRATLPPPAQDTASTYANILNITMQLKSNGSMFKYHLLTMVSDVLLRFLEKAEKNKNFNQDFIDILDVYIKVLSIIITKKLIGNGGVEGVALAQELHNACLRYYKKYNIE